MLPKHMHIIYRLDSKTRYIFNHIFKMIPCSDMTNKLFIRLVYGVKNACNDEVNMLFTKDTIWFDHLLQ